MGARQHSKDCESSGQKRAGCISVDPEGFVTKEILPADRTMASYDFRNKQIKV